LIFHRDLSNLFLLDSVLVHVPSHFQREYPEQCRPERSFEYLFEDAPESILRMRVSRGHFLVGNAEARVVETGGDVPPAAYRGEYSCYGSEGAVFVRISDGCRSV